MTPRARSRWAWIALVGALAGLALPPPALGQPLDAGTLHAAARPAHEADDAGAASDPGDASSGAPLLDASAANARAASADAAVSPGSRAPPTPSLRRRSTGSVARVTLGLFALLALVILGGSPAVRAFERRAGLTMVIGSGLPFLLLGVVARRPEVGILDDATLRDLTPVLEFGLAWIGFRVGADFDVRAMDRWPRGTARVMGAESACAFLVVVVVMGLALQAGLHPVNAVRNALILGACAAVSAPTGVRAMEAAGLLPAGPARDLRRVAALDDVAGVLVLGLVTSAFRPAGVGAWVLPPLGWLFLQLGMGVVHGALLVSAVRVARTANERFALTLGAIAFSAGMAGYVGFSPLVVGAVAGVVVANLPSAAEAGGLISAARHRAFERPIFMSFFVVTGALWDPTNRVGWALVPVYVTARLMGKLLGLRAARAAAAELAVASAPPPSPPPAEGAPAPVRVGVSVRAAWMALMPTSAVSIAVIVSVRALYPTVLSGALETVVILGALFAELAFRASLSLAGGKAPEGADLGALPIEHEALDTPSAPPPPPPSPGTEPPP